MTKYSKFLSALAIVSATSFASVQASDSTEMLVTIAETNPSLVERLTAISNTTPELSAAILKLAGQDIDLLERLVNLAEQDPKALQQVIAIETNKTNRSSSNSSIMGGVDDGGINY